MSKPLSTVPCDVCGIAGGTWVVVAEQVCRHPRTECANTLRAEVLRLRDEAAKAAAKE